MIIPVDKKLHFLGCYGLMATGALLPIPVWVVAALVFTIGLVKEWRDSKQKNNYWSWTDIIANTAGIFSYLCAQYLLSLLA